MTPYTSFTDDELVLLLRDNRAEGAFSELYDRWFEKVYNTAFKRLKDTDAAMDVTQDVFMRLWNRRAELQIRNLGGYLFIAVRNAVLELFRKESRYAPIEDLLLHLQASPQSAEATVLRKELLEAYHAMVMSLPPAQRTIFRMRFEDDMTTEEIAQALELSRKTVQNQLGKAVIKLRGTLTLLVFLLILARK